MVKVYKFPRDDGSVLTLTQDPNDPTKFSTSYGDGTTLSDKIASDFAAGKMRVKKK